MEEEKEIIDETKVLEEETKEKEDESKELVTIEKTGMSKLVRITSTDVDNSLSQMWGFDTTGFISEVNKNASLSNTKFGMLAKLPIICKGAQCAFYDTCTVDPANIIPGKRCPIEIGTIIARYTQYCKHFGVNIENNIIADEDVVDATLIKDLVVIEMQQMRCESKIAMSGDFMEATLVDIDKKCNPYYQDQVSPASEHLLTLQEKKTKLLNQLNATRKDKAMDKSKMAAPTENAIKIFQQMQEAVKNKTIIDVDDIDFDTVDDIQEIETKTIEQEEIHENIMDILTPEGEAELQKLLEQEDEGDNNGTW